ncbi:acyltransferase family protein [Oribacterium sp. WCC10]|uniref:acyltransferase family protein n=1 Tax=Oribacterium sp. WCC10 TaxID=1855343 RepID=UPI0008E05264|nr:acyltransferase [Oribacterium sp. WCC10]SFG35199.1 Acyltransferase family protein [Oribacterium sp. WCC10]
MEKSRFSNKVYVYTFILSILVILVHSVNFADDNSILLMMIQSSDYNSINLSGLTGVEAHIENFFSNSLGQSAVPGFFMMSGYLFFRNLSKLESIVRKWKERIVSLLLPFVAWNFLYYIIYLVMGKTSLGQQNMIDAIIRYKFNPVFWYLYQLILLTICAPMIYILLKNRTIAIASVIIYSYLVIRGINIPCINEDAILYYFAGAALAKWHRNFFESSSKRKMILGLALLFAAWISQIITTVGMQNFVIAPVNHHAMGVWAYWYVGGDISGFLGACIRKYPKEILVGVLSVGGQLLVNVFRRLLLCMGVWCIISSTKLNAAAFMKNGFFLYAIHYPIVRFTGFMLEYMNIGYHGTVERGIRLGIYVLLPAICVLVAYEVSVALKSHVSILWKILSGGR